MKVFGQGSRQMHVVLQKLAGRSIACVGWEQRQWRLRAVCPAGRRRGPALGSRAGSCRGGRGRCEIVRPNGSTVPSRETKSELIPVCLEVELIHRLGNVFS